MKRRGFLQAFAAITAASALNIFGKEPVTLAPRAAQVARMVVNPAYASAAYEDVFIFKNGKAGMLRSTLPHKPNPQGGFGHIIDIRASRYNRKEDGSYERVPYFLEVPVESGI